MNTNTNTNTNTNLTTAELWESVLNLINNASLYFFPDDSGEIWTDGDKILTGVYMDAHEIANVLETLGFDVVTGYYDPDDERPEEHDAYTGCYYVTLNS